MAAIAGIYAIMALGLYVQFSLAGLPNFGHVAFMAVAAYTMAILVVRYALPLPLAAARRRRRGGRPRPAARRSGAAAAHRLSRDRDRRRRRDRPLPRDEPARADRRADRLDRHARARATSRMYNQRLAGVSRPRAAAVAPLLGRPPSRDAAMAVLVWSSLAADRAVLAAGALALGAGAEGHPRGRDRGDGRRQERRRASSSRRWSWAPSSAASPGSCSPGRSACSARTTTSRR